MKTAQPYKVSINKTSEKSAERKRGYLYRVDGRVNGKRTARKFFKHSEKEKAELYAQELESEFSELASKDRANLDSKIIESAIRCQKSLSEYGATIEEASAFYIKHLEELRKKDLTPVSKIIGKFRETKNKRSPKYQKDLRLILGHFEKHFENQPLCLIPETKIFDWISSKGSDSNQKKYRSNLNVFFNYAVKQEVIEKNPLFKLDSIKVEMKVKFLTVDQCKMLLHHAPSEIEHIVAIMLFTGIRPDYEEGELSRLNWNNIRLDTKEPVVHLSSDITKTAFSRSIKIHDNLMQWILPARKPNGKIIEKPRRFRNLWDQTRKDAGLYGENWIHDGTRKTFITYHLALSKNESVTMNQSGHSNVNTLRRHYRGEALIEDAEAFFNIFPELEDNVIPINQSK